MALTVDDLGTGTADQISQTDWGYCMAEDCSLEIQRYYNCQVVAG